MTSLQEVKIYRKFDYYIKNLGNGYELKQK